MRKLNPFKPTDIGGCQLWLDGADVSTITGSSPVTAWRDKSANNLTVTATGAPTRTTVNGLNSLSFNGSSYFSLNPFTRTNGVSYVAWFAVANVTNAASAVYGTIVGTSFTANYYAQNQMYITSGSLMIWYRITFGAGASSTTVTLNPGNVLLGTAANFTTGTYQVFQNGVEGTLQTNGPTGINDSSTVSLQIGYDGYPGESYLQGTISELLLYTTVLTSPQRQQVEGYLAQKWGLQANLPAGSPGRTQVIYPRSPLIDGLTTGQPTRKPFLRSRALLNYIGFTLTGSTAASATNYQIPITVYRSSGTNTGSSVYLGTDIYSDYSNLYFLASDQVTALPFYIESGTQTTASATIWVYVPSIPASPSITKVYIYWNTTGTYTSPSNGTSTFPSLFDDFNGTAGGAPNASIWSVQLKGTSTSSSVQLNGSGEVILTPTDNSISSVSLLSLNTMPANGFSIYIRRKYTTGVYPDTSFATTNTLVASDDTLTSSWWHTTLGGGYMLLFQSTNTVIVRRQPTYTGSSQAATDIITPTILTLINTYEIVEIQYSTAGVINFIWNGVNKGTTTDTTFLSGGKYVLISQGNYTGYFNNVETVDYVFVRSYLNPEPSVTAWGSINMP
jgi:hypothetical protein